MHTIEDFLKFAEQIIHSKTDTYCSELQRRILVAALQEERKTYDQLAEECGYSPKYVKQDAAPKLWQLISQALDEKVNKANVRAVLAAAIHSQQQPDLIIAAPAISTTTAANILLVDDQPKNLRLLSDLLEEQGYEVQQAINGAIALQAVNISPPDLVLLDIHMPDIDGYTVCQKIKAEPATRDIPVIFISALDEPWDKVKAFSSGGCDYITKPFKVVEVLARVENHLKIHQLQQALMAQNKQLQRAIQELQRLAAIDELTQVASRRRFDAYLLQHWQQAIATRTPLTLMLAQVNNFDFYGEGADHTMGDRTLHTIAQTIQQTLSGPEDMVARYGTLTFAIVLPQQTASQGKSIAKKLTEQIEKANRSISKIQRSTPKKPPVSIALSIGIVSLSPDEQGALYSGIGAFLETCDRYLQQAKDSDRYIVSQ